MNKVQLFPYQRDTLTQTEPFNRVGYFLDMGLGKTFVGSEKLLQLGAGLNILICQKSKIDDWIEHFESYYSNYTVINMTEKASSKRYLDSKHTIQNCILVVNYELVFRRKFFATLEHFTLILDESSLIQNDKAKRTKFIMAMKPDNVILLSGTPTSGKYENLWSQCKLLGWDISSKLFNQQYVNWKTIEAGGLPIRVVDKENPYKNVERLKQKMREHGAVFLKTEDCYDLPAQTTIEVKVKTSKEYRKFRKNRIITLDTANLLEFHDDSDFYGVDVTPRVELIGDDTLTFNMYSRFLCGHYSKEKLTAFKDLCECQGRCKNADFGRLNFAC